MASSVVTTDKELKKAFRAIECLQFEYEKFVDLLKQVDEDEKEYKKVDQSIVLSVFNSTLWGLVQTLRLHRQLIKTAHLQKQEPICPSTDEHGNK